MSAPLIPVLRHAEIRAWPKWPEGGVARYMTVGEMLTSSFKYDAHFAQYSCPQMPRRLESKALIEENLTTLGGPLRMVLIVFDVDAPNHEVPTTEWREVERAKVVRLRESVPGVYMYETRHGYRLLAEIHGGFMPMEDPSSAKNWTRLYLLDVAYLRRVYDIQADPVKDWTRLFRCPHATRNEGERPENLFSIGDPNDIGIWWTPQYTDEDHELAKKLGKKEPKPKIPRNAQTAVDYHGRGVIGRLLSDDGLLGNEIEPGAWTIKCPLAKEHSTGKPFDDTTRYYEPSGLGHYLGIVDCMHTGHGHDTKTSKEWLELWPQDRIDSAREAEGLPAFKPPKATTAKTDVVRVEGAAQPLFEETEDPNGPDGVAVDDEPKNDPKWGAPTDLGNSERLAAAYGENLRYCPPKKCWNVYTGTHWQRDHLGSVQRMAKQTVRTLYLRANEETDPDRRAALGKHAVRSEGEARINAMVALTQTALDIAVLPEQFDSDPWLFNCPNGVLDLKTGKLLPHDRKYLMTRISPATFKAGAKSEVWDSFLNSATNGDAELQTYLQRVIGYCLTGVTYEKCFFFLFGPKNTGKSVFIESISTALGTYASTAAFSTWCPQTNVGGNRGDLVRLNGDRLVSSVEAKKGARFDDELMKAITGGDKLTYAAKFENEIEFKPQFKLFLAANDAPKIRDDDEASWDRVRRIPFTHAVAREAQDKHLREKLSTPEAMSAILAWAVEGCLAWQKAGDLGTCKAVEESVQEYRAENDRALGFISDCLEFFDTYRCSAGDMRTAYERWCKESGVKNPLTGNELAKRLEDKGAEPGKSNGVRFWKHVRLSVQLEDDDDEQGRQGRQGSALPYIKTNSAHERSLGNRRPSASLPTLEGVPGDETGALTNEEEHRAN